MYVFFPQDESGVAVEQWDGRQDGWRDGIPVAGGVEMGQLSLQET